MSQYQKERHAAAMLVHNIGSGIEALEDLATGIALENLETLEEDFLLFGRIIARLHEIKSTQDKIRAVSELETSRRKHADVRGVSKRLS